MTDDNGGKVTTIGLSKIRINDIDGDEIVKKQSLPRFSDHCEYGYYNGTLDATTGKRHGNGTMIYDSGNTYTGPFLNDKFHGDNGTYSWFDGDEQIGSWYNGERHGRSIFKCAVDGTVEYSNYENGKAIGEGVLWTANRQTAYKMLNGTKDHEISTTLAEKFALDKFGWSVPEPTIVDDAVVSSSQNKANENDVPTVLPSKSIGLLGRLFSSRKVGSDGTLFFKDYGEWGSYEGDVDEHGKRVGEGKMTYESGNYYMGGFKDDKFSGNQGVYHWFDGDEYSGGWKDGERHGTGSFTKSDGTVEYSMYEEGVVKGDGVSWSVDRKTAYKMIDGEKNVEMLIQEAESMAREKFDLPVPEPYSPTSTDPAANNVPTTSSKSIGLLGRLFSSRKVGPDGTLFCKDYGEWGSYIGGVDESGKRQGKGKMMYDSGNYYEGGFKDDKFHGDEGLYHWFDGDEYSGGWKDGERHGIGSFTKSDGTVEYSMYEEGVVKGDGVSWSADRTTAHKMLDGEKKIEMLVEEAESLSRTKFNLPIPEPCNTTPVQDPVATTVSKSKDGFIRRLFSNRKVGTDGKILYKDYGEWGSYDGDVDSSGNRQGRGKMTYDSGNYYEGGFSDDKFHGDEGLYHWHDGDEYSGGWQDGERHGTGTFRKSDGSVEYSMYDNGNAVGEGVTWTADRKSAHKMIDGERKTEISLGMAEKLAKENFDMPVPEPCTSTPLQESVAVSTSSNNVGFIGRLFSSRKVSPDGKPLFKDHGDWGSYEGDVDENGKRQGDGKMQYNSGNHYSGGFKDNKFHGDKGVYHWSDGDEYDGRWQNGERDGIGTFKKSDGTVEYSMYEDGAAKDGIWWSADRKTAYTMFDGDKKIEMLIEEAESMARDKFDLPIPEVSTVIVSPTPTVQKGFIRRLFSNRKVGTDGKILYKDYGEWGSYDGDVDSSGNRQGRGKMTYDSGNYYEGGFSDDKFHGDEGLYHWHDGDEYSGGWQDGERHGIGQFFSGTGVVEYSMYDNGNAVGEGVTWTTDRTTAHKMIDGKKDMEMSLAVAEQFSRDKFDLPVPGPYTPSISRPESKPSIIGRIFYSKDPSVTEGPRFQDFGDGGTYEGDLVNGLRQGEGKMSYDSGNSYEGDFSAGKFDGNRGLYRWADGTEYEGSWKDGERHGIGIYRTPSVGVDYSMYKNGIAVGVGVAWNDDFTKAFRTLDGIKMEEIPFSDAAQLSRDKFGLPVPSSKRQLGIISSLGRLFAKKTVGTDGKSMFKDCGDWGTYDGDVDSSGNRQGIGKMTYDSGNYYEGGFFNNKFHGERGIYRWEDGDEYEGSWKDGERDGIGSFKNADGSIEFSIYERDNAVGNGVRLSADRKLAHALVDGEQTTEMPIEEANAIVKKNFSVVGSKI